MCCIFQIRPGIKATPPNQEEHPPGVEKLVPLDDPSDLVR